MVYKLKGILKALNRRKLFDESFESPLRRCLVFIDLLLLGIGGSVDVALYVVLGNVIRDIVGPAVLISMPIGFIVCFGSCLCYAEFASYIPSSGSDYDYIYTSLGEIFGFFDGWSVLVASVIATAALAQGAADLFSSLTDSITFDNIDTHVTLPDHSLLATNMNIVALLIVMLVTIITAIGVHGSIRFNDCIVVINLLVVVFAVILGLFHLNFDYWSSWDKFAPYGVSGILKSLPFTVFFYGGFISVTFSTEEVINPSAILPRSIVASVIGIFVSFLLVGTVQSLIIPYNQLPLASPLSDTFGIVSFKASKYIIAVGGFCSCLSSVLTACYANSRLSYVMSRDGLLADFLGRVNRHTLVPINAVVVTGIIAALLAAFADLTILVEFCSILILLPYVLLSYAVIAIRYKENTFLIDKSGSGVCIENSFVTDRLGSDEQLPVHSVTIDSEGHEATELHSNVCIVENDFAINTAQSDQVLCQNSTTDPVKPNTVELSSDSVSTNNGHNSDIPGSDEQLLIHSKTRDSELSKTAEVLSKDISTNNTADGLGSDDEELTVHTVTRSHQKASSNGVSSDDISTDNTADGLGSDEGLTVHTVTRSHQKASSNGVSSDDISTDNTADGLGSDEGLTVHIVTRSNEKASSNRPSCEDISTDNTADGLGSDEGLTVHIVTRSNEKASSNRPSCEDISTDNTADRLGSDEALTVHSVTRSHEKINSTHLAGQVFAEGSLKLRIKISLGVFATSVSCLAIVVRCAITYNMDSILFGILMALFAIPLVVSTLVICKTPYTKVKFPFTMPIFPILPLLCLAMTLFVMLQFSSWSWILFGGNTIFGLLIYFCYGINHSQVQKRYRTAATDAVIMNTAL